MGYVTNSRAKEMVNGNVRKESIPCRVERVIIVDVQRMSWSASEATQQYVINSIPHKTVTVRSLFHPVALLRCGGQPLTLRGSKVTGISASPFFPYHVQTIPRIIVPVRTSDSQNERRQFGTGPKCALISVDQVPHSDSFAGERNFRMLS